MELLEVARWTASISAIVAAAMVSWRGSACFTGWGFAVFVGSSAMWIAICLVDAEHALTFQNFVLLGINLVGVWRWLIRNGAAEGETT